MDQEAFDRITREPGTRKSRRLAVDTLVTAQLFAAAFVEARDDALGGDKGGRRGPDHRGQNNRDARVTQIATTYSTQNAVSMRSIAPSSSAVVRSSDRGRQLAHRLGSASPSRDAA